jgi:hypothetical protein
MHTNMNFPAPLAVMGFVSAFGGLILGLIVVAVALLARKGRFAGIVAGTIAAGAAAYLALLLVFSLFSGKVVLARGSEKYFCEIDCHLAYSVVAANSVADGGANQVTVTVRTRFDPSTISPQRPKDAPLTPNARVVYLEDALHRRYQPAAISGTPLVTALTPGDFYISTFTFRVPQDATGLRLLIALAPEWENNFLIGEENSLLHRKTYLAL